MLYYLDRLTLGVSYPTDFDSLPRRKLGINYNSTYSSSNLSNAGVSSSLITENSRLTFNVKIMDSPALELIMLQPFGEPLFVESFILARQETDAFFTSSSTISLQQTKIIEMGINLGSNPVSWAEFAAGVRYQWAQAAKEPIIPAGGGIESVFIGNIFYSAYQLDSPILPTI